MTQLCPAFSAALKLRCDLALVTLCRKHGLETPVDESDLAGEAHSLGYSHSDAPSPSILFRGTVLANHYSAGAYCHYLHCTNDNVGTQEEWDALTLDQQFSEWEEFHELCMIGVADEMYFYEVLMRQHLVGYVGH